MKARSLALLPIVTLLLLAPRAEAQTTPTPEPTGPKENGFVFEGHLFSQLVLFTSGAGPVATDLVTGGIFGGYKLGRLTIGLGFDFSSVDGGGAQVVMEWSPGLRYAFVTSNDKRVELFGLFDFGIGHDFGSAAGNIILHPRVGPGVAYWVHPQFAFATVGGWTGQWDLYDIGNAGQKVVIQSMWAGVQALGVF